MGFQSPDRTRIDNQFSRGFCECGDPPFPRFDFCAVTGQKHRSDIFRAENLLNDMGILPGRDPETFSRRIENVRTAEFGFHSADRHAGVVRSVCHIALFVGDSLDHRDAFPERSVRIRTHESVHRRQDDGKIGTGHGRQ